MSIVKKVKDLAYEKGISIAALEREIGLANGAIYKWDKSSPTIDKLSKVANYFNVSTDYLLGKTDLKNYNDYHPTLTARDERDIRKDLEKMMSDLDSGEAGPTSYGGELNLSENDKEILKATLEQALRIIKLKNKETYTPHKYRRNNDNE